MSYSYHISILFFITIFISCTKNVGEELQPRKGNITESVYASGIIKAEDQYIVYASVSGVLQQVFITAGQSVVKDQFLFQLENDKATLNTQNARLAYQISQESSRFIQDKIADMETKVQVAKDKFILDQSVYTRNKNIKQYNVISEVDYERVETTYKNSKSNYESALKQLSQLKAQLVNDQNRNAINLKISEKSQSDFTIKSFFSGEVFDVLVKEGSLVNPQSALAIIGKKNSYVLELDVDENDMVRVKLGQKLLVTLDSYKGKAFDATVDKIYPIMDERSRTFKIEAHFDNPPSKLYPNLTAEANIVIQIKKNVITIPKSYLVDNEFVLINNDEKCKVKIGLSDYQNVEILEGLNDIETIYKPD